MNAWQEVRCPVCKKILFEAFGLSTHLLIRIHCRCKRVIQVKEAFTAEVLEEQQQKLRD
jgi:phage FluMu protein Com